MEKSELLQVRIEPDLKELLDDVAEQRGQSSSSLLRQILKAGLEDVAQNSTDPLQISITDDDS
ncbi:MAG: ribbon-helix-helix protein, CopG family [bacterium]